jgi:hypothetical protein
MTTLTNLIPDLYSNLDVVSRELTGFIPSVTLDPEASRAAVGQTVRSFVAPTQSAADISPGVTPPNDGDQTIGNVPITISKARRVPIRWSGEDDLGANSGPGASISAHSKFSRLSARWQTKSRPTLLLCMLQRQTLLALLVQALRSLRLAT